MASLSEKLKQVRSNLPDQSIQSDEMSAFNLSTKTSTPAIKEKGSTLKEKLKKVASFVNPLAKVQVRPPLAKDPVEIRGGKVIGGITDIGSRLYEDAFIGAGKVLAEAKASIQRRKGEKVTPLRTTTPLSYQKFGSSEVTTTQELENLSDAALKNIEKRDKESPNTRFMNLLKGATQEVFLPILDATDVIGVGELGLRVLRDIATTRAGREAFETLGVGTFTGDISEGGFRASATDKLKSIENKVKSNQITAEEAFKQSEEVKEAVRTLLTEQKTRLGSFGESIFNTAETLTKNRNLSSLLDDVRKLPAGLSIKDVSKADNIAEEISDIAENSLKKNQTGVRKESLKALKANPEEAVKGEVRLREIEDGKIVIEDGRHRLEVARETGQLPKIVDVTEEYTGIPSQKIQDLISKIDSTDPIETAAKMPDDTAIGARFEGDDAVTTEARKESGVKFDDDVFNKDLRELKKIGFADEAAGFNESADVFTVNGKPAIAVSFDGADISGISTAKDFRNQGVATQFLKEYANDLGGSFNVLDPNEDMMRILNRIGEVEEIDTGVFKVTVPKAKAADKLKVVPIRGDKGQFKGSVSMADETKDTVSESPTLSKNKEKAMEADIVEEFADNTQLVVHNISEEKILNAAKLGGLANPSIAVIDTAKQGLEGFGEITLLAPKQIIEKGTKTKVRVYGSDVYSPRFPPTAIKISTSDERKLYSYFDKEAEEVGSKLNPFSDVSFYDIKDSPAAMLKFVREQGINPDLVKNTNGEVSYSQTRDLLRKTISENNLEGKHNAWVDGILDKFNATNAIIDGRTPYGKAKLKDFTLENASKIMSRSGDRAADDYFYGLGSVRSNISPEFKSLANVKKAKGSIVTSEQFDVVKEVMDERFGKIIDDMDKYWAYGKDSNPFTQRDAVARAISDYFGNGRLQDFKDVPEKTLKTLNQFRDDLKVMPTEYFEAKFKRPVTLDEFGVAIVPDTVSDEVRKILSDSNLKVVEYTGGEAGRLKALKQFSSQNNEFAFGGVAGLEVDEEGNVDFDPAKAALGIAGMGLINKTKAKGSTKHTPIKTVNNASVKVPTSKTVYDSTMRSFKGTYEGKPYSTDSLLVELEDLPLKAKKIETEKAPDLTPIIKGGLEGAEELPVPTKAGVDKGKNVLQLGENTKLDAKYYNYLSNKYKDLRLLQKKGVPQSVIVVFDGKELKGAVMPLNMDRVNIKMEDLVTEAVTEKPVISNPVIPESKKGTAPANKVDDLRTALTNPEKVTEEAYKAQKRISGTLPDGSTAASEIGQATKIPKTPAKAARVAVSKGEDLPITIPDETIAALLQRKIQDKFNRLSFIQKDLIKKKGLPLSDDVNAYLQQEMFHGRAAERLDKFENTIITSKGQTGSKALLERMAKDDVDITEMGEFLHAKHARERNARVASINPDVPDGGSGMTNAQADKIISKIKADGKYNKYETYAQEFYEKVTKARLKILEEEHLLKPEAIEKIAGTFDSYVPLKIEQTNEIRLRGGRGFDVRGKDVKRIKGSSRTDRTNPLIQAIVDYEDAVIKAEKNKVGRTLKKLIEQNPNITNEKGEKIWEIKAQQYAPVYNKFGEVEFVQPVGLKLADNVMEVRDQGKIYHITMNDPALASAMKNLGTERGIKFFHQVNNYLRAVVTTYSPEFIITNFERDIQTALINTGGERGLKAAKDIAKDVKPALAGIYRETRGKTGKLVKGTDWAAEYKELKEVGGRVGWFDSKTVTEKTKDIQRRIDRVTGKTKMDKAARVWDGVAEYVSDINESVESGVRLSAYVNAKRAGLSKEQAASIAKNLTVNFNKKGEWGSAVNSFYLFANAGVQGTTRMFTALKHKRTRKIVAAISAFSFGVNYMNDQINSEGYAKLSDFEKNTNLIFMLPPDAPDLNIPASVGSLETVPNTTDRYLKLKLPYGYNVFKVIGDVSYDTSLGDETIGESLKRLVFAMDESFNPLSSGSAAQLVSPTLTDPVVQMWENKNFFGGLIKPEQDPYGAKVKQSDLYFSSVRQPTKVATDWLNDVSGGNQVESGVLDFSPENVDHIIDFLGGGVSKFIANFIDSGVKLATGDTPELNDAPFVRKFAGEVYKDVERSLFFEELNKSETRLLTEAEEAKFRQYGKEAFAEGQISAEQAKKYVKAFLENQNKIHAARVFEKADKLETKEERAEYFNKYMEENGLKEQSTAIKKEYAEIASNYKAKQAGADTERSFIGTIGAGIKGLTVDPENVLKAAFTKEKLGRVEGNLVELQRFYGLEFYEEGGSQEKKAELLQAQGINPTAENMKKYKLEHILPVKAGGDTSDSNLVNVTTDLHDSYTPIDIAVINAVQGKIITRKEAQELMTQLKVEKSITPQEIYDELKKRTE